jgi:PAS domain-containing protein
MAWQQTPYTLGYVAVAVAMCVIAALAYRSRERPGAKPLILMAVLTALWSGASAGVMARTTLAGKQAFVYPTYFSIAMIPVVLVYFAREYTSHELSLTRYGPGPLLVIPAITQVVVWTNQWHGLMWTRMETVPSGTGFVTLEVAWGPWFWVHAVYSYVLVAVATYALLRMVFVTEDVYRWQAVTILAGVFAPWVSNAVYIGGLVDLPFDPTPIAFSVTAVMFFLAIYRHQLLDLMPIAREVARDEMMDNLAEGVFVLDDEGRIVDVNERGETILDTAEHDLLGKELGRVVPEFATVLVAEEQDDDTESQTEVALRRNGTLIGSDRRISQPPAQTARTMRCLTRIGTCRW